MSDEQMSDEHLSSQEKTTITVIQRVDAAFLRQEHILLPVGCGDQVAQINTFDSFTGRLLSVEYQPIKPRKG